MKLTIKFLVVIFLVLFTLSFAESKKNVAVMEFQGKGTSDQDASMLADAFRSFLVNTGTFTVINRAHMEQILKEQSFQSSGCTDLACAVQIGKMLNMEYMFTGTASKFGETWMMTIDMIFVETSQIEGSKMKKVKGEMDALLDETEKIAVELAAQVHTSQIVTSSPQPTSTQKTQPEKSADQTPSKSGKLKPVLMGARAALMVGGAGAATFFGLLPTIKYNKYSDLSKEAKTAEFDTAYNEYADAYNSANKRIIIFSAVGGVGLISFIVGAATKASPKIGLVVPFYDGDAISLSYSKTF